MPLASIITPSPRKVVSALLIAALMIAGALVIAQDQETLRVRTPLAADDPRFPEYLAHLLGAPLTSGNLYIGTRTVDSLRWNLRPRTGCDDRPDSGC